MKNLASSFATSSEPVAPQPCRVVPRLIGHLDLKGVQLRPEFLFRYLETFARCGYEALVVEYEDLFPYQSADVALHRNEAWTPSVLRDFLAKAKALNLEIIPLQQCLGHLEYAFRWKRYRTYCLPTGYPSTLNLHLPQARKWLATLLNEVIEAHPHSRFIHLGMDEAYALVTDSHSRGISPLEPFLDHLDELCTLCERQGKEPVIWADMLERYISPEKLEAIRSFRDRVRLVSWNYHGPWRGSPAVHPTARFCGVRASHHWLKEARQTDAPEGLNDVFESFDDWPLEIAKMVKPYRVGEKWVKAFFPAAIWKEIGFGVWGGCGIATASDGAIMPLYHRRLNNVDTWVKSCRDYDLDGLMVTAWARGDTYRAPHVLPDAILPLIEYAAQAMGKPGQAALSGIPRERLWNLLWKMGRCQEDWYVQQDVLSEMKQLGEHLSGPDPLWQRLEILFRMMEAVSRLNEHITECEKRFFANRLVASEWEVRLRRLEKAAETLQNLQREARPLLDAYHGHALKEWITVVFEQPLEKCREVCHIIRQKRDETLCVYES